ncbi:zinc-binding dehydrogenase [Nonomuraea sp. NPDC051941]|uniref:zinc-binding dehydrogenase n=1 Tax=Nonomuraea sp. NPDC051941 TaxID=3364373 RepID=UPI0037C87CE3
MFELDELTAGQRVLITGAGGAVGAYAVQLAKTAGAHVIATASPRSADRVRAAGADEVLDHTTTDVVDAVIQPVDLSRAVRRGRGQHHGVDAGAERRRAPGARAQRLRPE